MGVLEGEDREKGTENLFKEIMAENFPSLVKETDIQVQETESPKQDESKEAHTKTHILKSYINKDFFLTPKLEAANKNKLNYIPNNNNHILKKVGKKIQVTFTSLSLKIKGPKELHRNLKFNLIG